MRSRQHHQADCFVNEHLIGFVQRLISDRPSLAVANQRLYEATGMAEFFSADAEMVSWLTQAREGLTMPDPDLGDFQTPPRLAQEICRLLLSLGCAPKLVIEPTCGKGNLAIAAVQTFPEVEFLFGVELQERYIREAKLGILKAVQDLPRRITSQVVGADIFRYEFPSQVQTLIQEPDRQFLILGNPPWVTNSALSSKNSSNLPPKSNIKKERGLAARTGRANFDLAEAIILRLILMLKGGSGRIAMLCKYSVARKLLQAQKTLCLPLKDCRFYSIDTARQFGVTPVAGLFYAELAPATEPVCTCAELSKPEQPKSTFGWVGAKFVIDVQQYKAISQYDGSCPLTWRQGVKHDAYKVLVLKPQGNEWRNGYNEPVHCESQTLYPFLKGSELRAYFITQASRRIILTQSRLGDNPAHLAAAAPQTWQYLNAHAAVLDARKSSIYRSQPRFGLFGIGDYAFSPYKVAIAGFYKEPRFALVAPQTAAPIMLDDTSYYLSFSELPPAIITWVILNSQKVSALLNALAAQDAKRPFSKEVLQRIDLGSLLEDISFQAVSEWYRDKSLKLAEAVTQEQYETFRCELGHGSASLHGINEGY